jgi:hypothetical protein
MATFVHSLFLFVKIPRFYEFVISLSFAFKMKTTFSIIQFFFNLSIYLGNYLYFWHLPHLEAVMSVTIVTSHFGSGMSLFLLIVGGNLSPLQYFDIYKHRQNANRLRQLNWPTASLPSVFYAQPSMRRMQIEKCNVSYGINRIVWSRLIIYRVISSSSVLKDWPVIPPVETFRNA